MMRVQKTMRLYFLTRCARLWKSFGLLKDFQTIAKFARRNEYPPTPMLYAPMLDEPLLKKPIFPEPTLPHPKFPGPTFGVHVAVFEIVCISFLIT